MLVKGVINPWQAYCALDAEKIISFQACIELRRVNYAEAEATYLTTWKFEDFLNDPRTASPVERMTELEAFERIFEFEAKEIFESLKHEGGGHHLVTFSRLVEHTFRRMKTNKRTWELENVADLARAFIWMFNKLATADAHQAVGRTRSVRKDKSGKPIHFDRELAPPRKLPWAKKGSKRKMPDVRWDHEEAREIKTPDGQTVQVRAKVYAPIKSQRPDYIVRVNNQATTDTVMATDITSPNAKFAEFEHHDIGNDQEELFITHLGNARALHVIRHLKRRLQYSDNPAHADPLAICNATLADPALIRDSKSSIGWRRKHIAKRLNWEIERVDRALDFFRSRTGDPAPAHELIGASTFDEAVHPANPAIGNNLGEKK